MYAGKEFQAECADTEKAREEKLLVITGVNPAGDAADAGDTSPIFWLGGRQRK